MTLSNNKILHTLFHSGPGLKITLKLTIHYSGYFHTITLYNHTTLHTRVTTDQ